MARAHIYILSFASSRSLSFSHFHFIVFVMPRSIILRPPGGDSGIKRKRYSAREKIAILAKIRRIKRETGLSYRKAAASLGVSHTLVIRWRALRERFDNLDLKRLPRYSVAHGPCSQLEGVTEELLAWIFERREMGLVVSTLSVIIKACCILPIMEQKSALARVMVIRRFLKKHSLVYRMGPRCHSVPPARWAKRRRSSRNLSVRCS
jgi:transposase-like protein